MDATGRSGQDARSSRPAGVSPSVLQVEHTVIAETLRRRAVESGKTQRELAERVGCSEAAMSRFVNGKTTMRVDRLDLLAAVLGCRFVDKA